MISWRTTVDPATASYVTSYSRDTYRYSSGGGGQLYISQTRSVNWSGTTVTEDNQDIMSTYTSVFITSVSFTRNIETSTVAQVGKYSWYTTSTSSTFANWTTTGSGDFTIQSTTRTAITTAESVFSGPLTTTTTLSLTELNPGFFATIVQAADTEVLWTASTSAATDFTGFVAASNAAATTSRVTIRPYLQTVSVSTVNSSSTSQKINPELSVVVTYNDTSYATLATTAVGNALRFPMATITAEAQVLQTLTTETLVYAFPETITGHNFATSAIPATSAVSIPATVGTLTYVTTQSVWTTISKWKSFKVALSSSSSSSDAYPAYSASFYTDIGQSVTAFGNPIEQLIVVPGGDDSPAAAVFAPKGFHNGAGFYSAPVLMEVSGLQIVSHSRGISTILPGTYDYTSGSQSGVVTISGLSGSYKSETTVSSFVLSPNGAASVDGVGIVGFGGALGASETAFVYFPPGLSKAYVGTATSSFSTSGGFSSYSGSSPTKWFEQISHLQPGETGDDLLCWSAERNRTYTP